MQLGVYFGQEIKSKYFAINPRKDNHFYTYKCIDLVKW